MSKSSRNETGPAIEVREDAAEAKEIDYNEVAVHGYEIPAEKQTPVPERITVPDDEPDNGPEEGVGQDVPDEAEPDTFSDGVRSAVEARSVSGKYLLFEQAIVEDPKSWPLDRDQLERAEALKIAREVLRDQQVFGSKVLASVDDILRVARYVVTGLTNEVHTP